MTCGTCGAPMREDAERFPSCAAPVRREGWLRRVLRALGAGTSPARRVSKTTYTIRTQRIELKDPKTGDVRVCDSLKDLPEEIRKKIDPARLDIAATTAPTTITVTDASGTTRTYDSVDQMPADVRALYARARAAEPR